MTFYLWLLGMMISIPLTAIVASKFHLQKLPSLIILNVLFPFTGLVYALYVVHYILPKVVKQQTGQDIESPLQPYINYYWDLIKTRVLELIGSKNDNDKTL